jgi:DNA-binding transcriptional LysR family regulator
MDMLSDGSIELRHITTFLAIAEERSFGRAADRLGYTQSAVSQQIAALERAVGTPVFLRPGGPRPVELTEAGRVLLGHAEVIAARLRTADADLRAFQEGALGTVRVGSFQSVSVKLLPTIVRTLASTEPDIALDLVEDDDAGHLLGVLERHELDATVVVSRLHAHPFREQRLFEDPFVATAPPGTFPPGPIHVRDLDGRPLIGQQPGDMCQVTIEAGLHAAGLDPRFVFRSADNAAVQAMARAGGGVALMPKLAIDETDVLVSLHPIVDIAPREVVLVWRDTADVSPAVERFVELALDVAAGIRPDSAA